MAISRKIDFTGTPHDFVEMVRLFHEIGGCTNMQTGEPATREDIAATFMQFMNVDLGGYPDYKTLELCSNGSDLPERMLNALEEMEQEMKKRKQDSQDNTPEPGDDVTGL